MRLTSSRPTCPNSTIRATSSTSGVVTRKPPLKSPSMPRRLSIELICGPPPCTTTGWMPQLRRNTMSAANGGFDVSMGQVVVPDARLFRPDAEVDGHFDVDAGQVDIAGAGRPGAVDAHRRT